MAIFRCPSCGFLREVANDYIGKSATCPKCKKSVPIYDTLQFLQKVLKQYALLRAEITQLKAANQPAAQTLANPKARASNPLLEKVDLHNTTLFAEKEQYQPILQWFKTKQIDIDIKYKKVDTSGFFDEIAVKLGDNYPVLKNVSDKIIHTQRKGYVQTAISLDKFDNENKQLVMKFCDYLYKCSFLSRSYYNKEKNKIYLSLQKANTIVHFFQGEWLEWYVFMKIANILQEKKIAFSALRSVEINFPNGDKNELDTFFLLDKKTPLCIECKSGEFRPYIDKYLNLCKRLKLDKSAFWLVIVGLSDQETQALTAMYDLTFLNEHSFLTAIPA